MKVTKEQQKELQRLQRVWKLQEANDIEDAKSALASEYGLERDSRFDLAWNLAWDYGHSSGISEVKNYFHDIVPLLKLEL